MREPAISGFCESYTQMETEGQSSGFVVNGLEIKRTWVFVILEAKGEGES